MREKRSTGVVINLFNGYAYSVQRSNQHHRLQVVLYAVEVFMRYTYHDRFNTQYCKNRFYLLVRFDFSSVDQTEAQSVLQYIFSSILNLSTGGLSFWLILVTSLDRRQFYVEISK